MNKRFPDAETRVGWSEQMGNLDIIVRGLFTTMNSDPTEAQKTAEDPVRKQQPESLKISERLQDARRLIRRNFIALVKELDANNPEQRRELDHLSNPVEVLLDQIEGIYITEDDFENMIEDHLLF